MFERVRRGPQVTINRAFAIARAQGPESGLSLLEGIAEDEPFLAVVRGVLYWEAGRFAEAIAELEHARTSARNIHEVAQIDAHIERVNADRA